MGVWLQRVLTVGGDGRITQESENFVEIRFCLYREKNKGVKIFFSTISFDIRCPAKKNFIDEKVVRRCNFERLRAQ
jgi:hypothetical protein